MKTVFLISTALTLAGCAPAILGGGTLVGSAAVSEQGVTGAFSDTQISTQIRLKLYNHSPDLYASIGVNVHNGEVMLTGKAPNEVMHLDAVRLTWQVRGVIRVIDNITDTQDTSFKTYARDSWITTKLNSALLFDKHIHSVNYTIKTMSGVVYIMGIAQNETELKRVTNHARNTAGVNKVISYVAIKDAPAEEIPSAEASVGVKKKAHIEPDSSTESED